MGRRICCAVLGVGVVAFVSGVAGCTSYPFFPVSGAKAIGPGGVFGVIGRPFAEELIQGRTFINGTAVTTVLYRAGDLTRTPIGIDFNGDGKIDPVVAYGQRRGGVIQILLSDGPVGSTEYISLTLDGNGRWQELSDVAVGDIDGDGMPDIIAASQEGVVYLRHPGPGNTTVLREWGAGDPELEYLSGSTDTLTKDEIEAIIADVLPPGTGPEDFHVTLDQGYTRVQIADFDRDGFNDIVASRRFQLLLEPKDASSNLKTIEIIAGELQLFLNPGGAVDGVGWELISLGMHERYVTELDRQGAIGLLVYDFNGDGNLDILSAARDDENVQIMWFEHPGLANLRDGAAWRGWRVGSVRDALAVDIADLTGDGRVDVVAVGGAQKQMVLFEQPTTGPQREYDWDRHAIVTFDSFEPRDVRALDLNFNGRLELVVAGTNGALRYFEPGADPRQTWNGVIVLNFDPPGDIGLLGYGDMDGDGDLDLVAVVSDSQSENNNADRVIWVRNQASLLD